MNVENKMNENTLEEQPLGPESEKLRKRLVKMLGVSIGTLVLGIAAVLFAIIYKINGGGESDIAVKDVASTQLSVPSGMSYEGSIDLPEGAKISSSSIDGNHVMLRVELSSGTSELWLYDIASNRIFGRITIK